MPATSQVRLRLAAMLLTAGAAAGATAAPRFDLVTSLPDKVYSGATYGEDLLVAAGRTGLLRISNQSGRPKTVALFPNRLATKVVVSGTTAVVATFDDALLIHTISLTEARANEGVALPESREFDLGRGIILAAALSDDRIVVIAGPWIQVLNAWTGHTLGSVKVPIGMPAGLDIVDGRMYVASHHAGGLTVIDIEGLKVVDVLRTDAGLHEVKVADGRALVKATGNLGIIDLAAREFRPVQVSGESFDQAACQVLRGEDGRFFLASQTTLYQLDRDGLTVATTALPKGASVIALRKTHALAVNTKQELVRVTLESPMAAQAGADRGQP